MAEKESSVLAALVMTVVVVGVIVGGSVYVVKHFELSFDLSEWLNGRAKASPIPSAADLPVARGPDRTIDASRMAELRQMLAEERFEALNAALEQFQNAFSNDSSQEFALYDAYQSFAVTAPDDEVLFDRWINAHPDQYQPYLAAAHYYYTRGWQSRGFKWKKDTTEEQFQGMAVNFTLAEERLETALGLNDELMPAYKILIGIYNAGGEDQLEDRTIKRATLLFPSSYLIGSTAMWARQPRWGGSYRQMQRIADDAQDNAVEYPILTALYGEIFYDQARDHRSNEAFDQAIEAINTAISYGDRYGFYCERAKLLAFDLKEFNEAMEDVNHAIELRPTKCSSYLLRAKIHFARESYGHALDDLKIANFLQPGEPSTLQWCASAARKLNQKGHRIFRTDLEEAVALYNLSLSFNAQNAEAHYWRGVANYELGRVDAALADMHDCIQLDKTHFNAYRMLDHLLAKDRQWEAIIRHWDTFLELDPEHAEAYFERSGAHYHNRAMSKAIEDLQQACDLGHEKACRQYQKINTP